MNAEPLEPDAMVDQDLPLVHHPGSAVVIALTQDDSVLVVRQHRLGARAETVELPQEKLQPGESAVQAARRGLEEECGVTAHTWRPHGILWAVPAYSDHRVHVFSARVGPATERPAESTGIQVERLPLLGVASHLEDAISLAAVLLCRAASSAASST